MATISYAFGISLDGYIEDADGGFGWSAPSDEAHRISNEQTRAASTFLFGRHIYEIMEEYWTSAAARGDGTPVEAEFARLYVETPRIVFSDTLASVGEGCRLVRRADARAEVERLKRETAGTMAIAGAALAASMIDLIDDFRLLVYPVAVGGGKPFFPAVREALDLTLVESRTLDGGILYMHYERR